MSYQMIDDARRMVGEAFRGQPAEGYAAIGETALKKYYPMLSKVQKDFAGEKQAQLLDDYAASRPGLEIFVSKSGKKITGVDPKAREQLTARRLRESSPSRTAESEQARQYHAITFQLRKQ